MECPFRLLSVLSVNGLLWCPQWLQRMADTAARVTGKVYRVVAGTDNAGLGFKIPTTYNQQQDDSDNKDSDSNNNNNNSNDDNKSSASNINTSFSFGNSFVPRLVIAKFILINMSLFLTILSKR